MNKLLFDLDITLLEIKDIFGKKRLSIFDKYGTKAAITDFAILLGGDASDFSYTNDGNVLKDRTGDYFTKTKDGNDVYAIYREGTQYWIFVNIRCLAVRPVLSYSSILGIFPNEVREKQENIVEFGEYPQTIENIEVSNELEKLYNDGKLQITGKNYTTDSIDWYKYYEPFKERNHVEYEYNGKKYIRILGDCNSVGKIISDERKVREGVPYWVKVEPIEWLIDKERDIAVTKKLLFSGVQFCNGEEYKGDFNSTNLHYFLNNYFFEDIIPSNYKIKYYLVSSNNVKYLAYEKDEELRELYTNMLLVPEDANYYPDNSLINNEVKEITFEEIKEYLLDTDKITYLNYLKEACKYSNNKSYYNKLSIEYTKEKIGSKLSLKL